MGAGGIPSGGVVKVYGRSGDLPTQCDKPNSRWDLYDSSDGVRIQSRWFDPNGVVIRNRDFRHQDAHRNHKFPHDHTWKVLSEKVLSDGYKEYTVKRSKDDIDPDKYYNSDWESEQ